MRNNVFWLCGEGADKQRLGLGTKSRDMHSILFCTLFVRSMSITNRVSARLFRVLCAHKNRAIQSISVLVFPIIPSPYYYVCSDLSKKLINNRRCA